MKFFHQISITYSYSYVTRLFLVALPDLKKLKISVENLHSEKVKLEKQNAKKPASKGKGKVTLKKESDVSKIPFLF